MWGRDCAESLSLTWANTINAELSAAAMAQASDAEANSTAVLGPREGRPIHRGRQKISVKSYLARRKSFFMMRDGVKDESCPLSLSFLQGVRKKQFRVTREEDFGSVATLGG